MDSVAKMPQLHKSHSCQNVTVVKKSLCHKSHIFTNSHIHISIYSDIRMCGKNVTQTKKYPHSGN